MAGRKILAPICIDDFEIIAKSRLPKLAYDYYRSGADDEITLNRNVEAYKKLIIRPRFLIDVSNIDTSVSLLNGALKLKSPICVAATASQKLAHADGELATSRGPTRIAHFLAASKAETLMIVSTIATSSLESVAQAAPGSPRWFQLYIYKDRSKTLDLIRRAEKAGYGAIVVTVDTPTSGKRRDDMRNEFKLPPTMRMENFEDTMEPASGGMNDKGEAGSGFASYVNSLFDPSLTWSTIDWLKNVTQLPIILKGILTAEDAKEACKHNVAAIIVSNHGARQLDSAPATIEALPEIVQASGDKLEIYIDGGIRTGNSVLKAIALGAKAVFVGRPVLWGLAYDGQHGVGQVLDILNQEFRTTMALSGCREIEDIRDKNRKLVVHETYFASKI